jgi:hypothetical protein
MSTSLDRKLERCAREIAAKRGEQPAPEPVVLTEADAAADLAGIPRPKQGSGLDKTEGRAPMHDDEGEE